MGIKKENENMDINDKRLLETAKRTGKRFISNAEFFSSNDPGCFYEGKVKDANGKWVDGPEITARKMEEADWKAPCFHCGSESRSNPCGMCINA